MNIYPVFADCNFTGIAGFVDVLVHVRNMACAFDINNDQDGDEMCFLRSHCDCVFYVWL